MKYHIQEKLKIRIKKSQPFINDKSLDKTPFLSKIEIIFNFLNPLRPMEFSIKFDAFKPGWYIIYIEGSQAIISNEAHPGILGNRGKRVFISGEQGNKGLILRGTGEQRQYWGTGT